ENGVTHKLTLPTVFGTEPYLMVFISNKFKYDCLNQVKNFFMKNNFLKQTLIIESKIKNKTHKNLKKGV
ncbi:MAG: hypothetical protein ACUVXA_17570, partial [Candidatus Jordarchaeum sp.]|uniref:hypothetical protein n=1 Tax=Candidatus Jordarchaeum sp. TaxID=2823881 RepID=UPI004049A84C